MANKSSNDCPCWDVGISLTPRSCDEVNKPPSSPILEKYLVILNEELHNRNNQIKHLQNELKQIQGKLIEAQNERLPNSNKTPKLSSSIVHTENVNSSGPQDSMVESDQSEELNNLRAKCECLQKELEIRQNQLDILTQERDELLAKKVGNSPDAVNRSQNVININGEQNQNESSCGNKSVDFENSINVKDMESKFMCEIQKLAAERDMLRQRLEDFRREAKEISPIIDDYEHCQDEINFLNCTIYQLQTREQVYLEKIQTAEKLEKDIQKLREKINCLEVENQRLQQAKNEFVEPQKLPCADQLKKVCSSKSVKAHEKSLECAVPSQHSRTADTFNLNKQSSTFTRDKISVIFPNSCEMNQIQSLTETVNELKYEIEQLKQEIQCLIKSKEEIEVRLQYENDKLKCETIKLSKQINELKIHMCQLKEERDGSTNSVHCNLEETVCRLTEQLDLELARNKTLENHIKSIECFRNDFEEKITSYIRENQQLKSELRQGGHNTNCTLDMTEPMDLTTVCRKILDFDIDSLTVDELRYLHEQIYKTAKKHQSNSLCLKNKRDGNNEKRLIVQMRQRIRLLERKLNDSNAIIWKLKKCGPCN